MRVVKLSEQAYTTACIPYGTDGGVELSLLGLPVTVLPRHGGHSIGLECTFDGNLSNCEECNFERQPGISPKAM